MLQTSFKIQQFFRRNITRFGFLWQNTTPFLTYTCPAQEKTLSDGVDEACTHRYVFESADNLGRLSRFPTSRLQGLVLMGLKADLCRSQSLSGPVQLRRGHHF